MNGTGLHTSTAGGKGPIPGQENKILHAMQHGKKNRWGSNPNINRCMDKANVVHTYSEYYSALKNEEILPYASIR